MLNQTIGRYHIIEKLGEGGMAIVYKAFDTRLECDVAFKMIRPEKITPETLNRLIVRFEQEAKEVARLSHPNIVPVMDYGEQDGTPYLVMKYISGGTLKKKLTSLGKPMDFHQAAGILIPVAKALAYAHQQKIIHRDVKPANILITESGESMLSDFGIAKILASDNETHDSLTGTGVGIGTPEYMAPEQASGDDVDQRSDIYALGIVFYEMVTGRRPFVADTPMAVVIKQATEPLPRPRQFVPGLPEIVEKVIFKSLAKKPENRYQNMAEFAVALEKLAVNDDKMVHVWEPGVGSHSIWTWITVAVVVLLVVIMAGSGWAINQKFHNNQIFLSMTETAVAGKPSAIRTALNTPDVYNTEIATISPILATKEILSLSTSDVSIPTISSYKTNTPTSSAKVTNPVTPAATIKTSYPSNTIFPAIANQNSAIQSWQNAEYELEDVAVEKYTDADRSQLNRTLLYTINLENSRPLLWIDKWCAIDQNILENNLQDIQMDNFIGDQLIDRNKFSAKFYTGNGWNCVDNFILIDKWQPGTYQLKRIYRFSSDVFDGETHYPQNGVLTREYTVNVGR